MIHLGAFPVWIHTVLESLAFLVGGRVYARTRKADVLPLEKRTLLMGACILGAALGAKLTVWADNPGVYWQAMQQGQWGALVPGKGIAGALVGGWLATEGVKKCLGITQATGDVLVFPLTWAIAVGRLGCFLVGLQDQTYGVVTSLPWAVDFGDGLGRHPTQVYEIVFLALLGLVLWRQSKRPTPQGQLFRWWMMGYFGFRFLIEFLKPIPALYGGLNSVQLLSLGVLLYYHQDLWALLKAWRVPKTRVEGEHHAG